MLSGIIKAPGGIKAAKLEPRHVEQLLTSMADQDYATKTISITRSILVSSLNRAIRDGVLNRNVADVVETPKGKVRKSKALSSPQVAKLLALDLSPWSRAYILTGAPTGMRPGEILGLCWPDCDLEDGVFYVRHSLKPLKDREGRTVRGPDGRAILVPADLKTETSRRELQLTEFRDVAQALTVVRKMQAKEKLASGGEYQDRGLIFCDPLGHGMWTQHVTQRFKALCKRASPGG